jgi:hypothetical protein
MTIALTPRVRERIERTVEIQDDGARAQALRELEGEAARYYMNRSRGEDDYDPRRDPVPPVAGKLGDVRKAKVRASSAASAIAAALESAEVPRKHLRAIQDDLAKLRELYSPHLSSSAEAAFAEIENVAAELVRCEAEATPELRARARGALGVLAPHIEPAPVKRGRGRGRPVDGARLMLAINVERILRRAGVPITRGRKGRLALTLEAIVAVIDVKAPGDLFPLVQSAVLLSETAREAEAAIFDTHCETSDAAPGAADADRAALARFIAESADVDTLA